MRTLYIDCSMGAAGDMLCAALLELMPDPDAVLRELNALGIPGVEYRAEKTTRQGVSGTRMHVTVYGQEEGAHDHHSHGEHSEHHDHHGGHVHRNLQDIREIVYPLPLSVQCKLDVLAVYNQIARAESHAHRCPVTQVHFHEVGNLDAIADITAACWMMNKLAPDQVLASPIHVGCGTVHCAHGELPVPAPATAFLLQGVPTYSDGTPGELCTPTGAALVTHFADAFTPIPRMRAQRLGKGLGSREFSKPNCLNLLLGEALTRED